MTTSAHILAKLIVQRAGTPISNLKLQKLLYYVQGWHLGIHGKPIFHEHIEAWVHGPVVPVIFREFRDFKWNPIVVDERPVQIDLQLSGHALAVLGAYGKLTAAQLEAVSHLEEPWIEARKGLDPREPSHAVITHASMKRFFGKLAHA